LQKIAEIAITETAAEEEVVVVEDRLAEEPAATMIDEVAHLKEGIEGMDRDMAVVEIMKTVVVTVNMAVAAAVADTRTDEEEDLKTEAEEVAGMADKTMTTSTVVVVEEVDVETSVEIVEEDTGEIEIVNDKLKTNSAT
jgi:hypothetical protein